MFCWVFFSGLVKFCTFGFMLLWHLVDILLIAMQASTWFSIAVILEFLR